MGAPAYPKTNSRWSCPLSLKYRPEIDGLRTIAVLPVVFFHAGFVGFSGGYVGVDIFFVISGFLITTILLREAEGEGISLVRFYERRARRILPALFLVILTSIPLAWLTMYPSQMEDFSQSILSVLFFISNIYFWREDDYFGPRAEEMPLLHTWSLSVEEQFYVVFPLLLILCFWLGRRYVLPMLIAATVASFTLCLWVQSNPNVSPSAAFYLLPTRAWELGIGSLCSYYLMKRPRIGHSSGLGDVLSLVGLALIIWSIVMFDKATPMPSAHTLVPTLGAALIILSCGSGGIAYRLLTFRAMIWIGLISYSLYLWHQPLFAFARIAVYGDPEPWHFGLLIVLAFGLAYGTWCFLETPMRDRTKIPGKVFFSALGVLSVLFFVSAAAEWRYGLKEQLVFSGALYANVEFPEQDPLQHRCMSHAVKMLTLDEVCQHADGDTKIAVLGNSHAGGFGLTLAEHLKGSNIGVQEYTASACSFSYELPRDQVRRPRCFPWFRSVVTEILSDSSITDIVVAFRWDFETPDGLVALESFVHDATLREKRVIVVNQAPLQREGIDFYIFNRITPTGNAIGISVADWQNTYRNVRQVMERISETSLVIEVDDIFCDSVNCFAVREGVSLYRDDDHMSLQAARRVTQRIANILQRDLTQ